MNALSSLKKFNIVILALSFCFSSYAASTVDWPDTIVADSAKDLSIGIVEDRQEDGKSFLPEDVEEEIIGLADDLYAGGVAKLEHYNTISCKVSTLKKLAKIKTENSVPTDCYKNFLEYVDGTCKPDVEFSDVYPVVDGTKTIFKEKYKCSGVAPSFNTSRNWFKIVATADQHEKNLWKGLYANVIQSFFDKVKADRNTYAEEYELATARQCEPGLMRLPHADFSPGSSCTKKAESCSTHSDCCSGYCQGEETQKTCSQPLSCYSLLEEGQQCGKLDNGGVNPYCNPGNIKPDGTVDESIELKKQIECTQVNMNTSEINECTPSGYAPKTGKPCCSTKTDSSGKCTAHFVCSKCAKNGEKPTSDEQCCPGYYKSLSGVCVQDFPPLMLDVSIENKTPVNKESKKQEKHIFQKIFDLIIPSAHSQESVDPNSINPEDSINCIPGLTCESGLSAEEEQARANANRTCMSPKDGVHPSADEINECMKKADLMYKDIANKNIKEGATGEIWTREKYQAQFNMTAITSKTVSDFDTCTFNAFNDSWFDAQPDERNAEIVLRGFEFLFSGNGTQDFWYDKTQSKNIYERAQKVAHDLRLFRSEQIAEFAEMNRKMTCKCIVAFGKSKFPEKASFFESSCSDVTNLADIDGKNLENIGNESTSLEDSENKSSTETKEADGTDTDLGAIGIAGEKLLLEFLALRNKAQLKRFDYNAKLEVELEELAKFIRENEWEQSSPNTIHLYDFKVKKTAGWVKALAIIIVVVVAVAFTIVTMGVGGAVIGAIAGAIAGVAGAIVGAVALVGAIALSIEDSNNKEALKNYSQAVAQNSIYGEGLERNVHDEVKRDWYCKNWICFTKYKEYKRYYTGPRFNSSESDQMKAPSETGKICSVFASSRVCFRNIHLTGFRPDEDKVELRYLLDAKVTEFMPNPSYTLDSNFVGMNGKFGTSRSDCTNNDIGDVNKAYWCGIGKLIDTKPSKTVKLKFLDEDMLLNDKVQDAFQLQDGEFLPELFNESHVLEVKNAVRQYASCSKMPEADGQKMLTLKDCGAIFLPEGHEHVLGFGLLFENSEDIKHFEEYVYQHHFHWPSISASDEMAYPTMALSSYFEAIVFNLRIVGSKAALRAMKNGEMYDLYLSDWRKRLADYKCDKDDAGNYVCAEAQMGDGSKNVAYSKKFMTAFNAILFEAGKLPDGIFGADGTSVNSSSGFSQGEADLLATAAKKAIREAEYKKRYDHYMETVGTTERGKQKIAAQQEWKEKFMEPLRTMPLTVGGKQFGITGSSTTNTKTKTATETKKKSKVAEYKVPEFKFDSSQYGNSSYNSKVGSNSSDSDTIKTGLQDSLKNSYLLDSALKSKEMFERDDSDSIFKILSKAYYRNLDLILERATIDDEEGKKVPGLEFKAKKDNLSNDKKSELKKLLSQ